MASLYSVFLCILLLCFMPCTIEGKGNRAQAQKAGSLQLISDVLSLHEARKINPNAGRVQPTPLEISENEEPSAATYVDTSSYNATGCPPCPSCAARGGSGASLSGSSEQMIRQLRALEADKLKKKNLYDKEKKEERKEAYRVKAQAASARHLGFLDAVQIAMPGYFHEGGKAGRRHRRRRST
mmetsp:Transcript_28757/g.34937  ORF Transcript_28757/g.34937 Transcript_28757/m.34937 type:complete len:183 (-) Transcript_28757:1090-1638(-)|eukprot:CAMPEP_0197853088 /NCGR_PEP_ID=MMETSP1438-20131217/22047_1 /TAXON_ID=1461541 /ORGANISM="Pterosperma sp., Strain CCMP1384" /LENGTH=182 /DNA_ID=CAMNT_0043467373 /DNA_START=166 /DNA_END=714 /DNA_ORIENTATION=+